MVLEKIAFHALRFTLPAIFIGVGIGIEIQSTTNRIIRLPPADSLSSLRSMRLIELYILA